MTHTDAGALLKLADDVVSMEIVVREKSGQHTRYYVEPERIRAAIWAAGSSIRLAASQGREGGERSEVRSESVRTATLWFEQQIENAKQDQISGFRVGPQVRGERAHARHCALYEAQQIFLEAIRTPDAAQEAWKCQANPRTVVPEDCDWPNCGCDPHAQRVMQGLIECGWEPPASSVPSAHRGCGDPNCKDPNCEYGK